MKVTQVIGATDSRILVYSLARALSLTGQTAIFTDDGAYRRLYESGERQGTVSNIDIFVEVNIDNSSMEKLKDTGIKYDNVLVVSCDYKDVNTDNCIVCKTINNSMNSKTDKVDGNVDSEKSSGGLFGKKKKVQNNELEEQGKVKYTENIEPLTTRELLKIPDDVAMVEILISYEPSGKKGEYSIQLRDEPLKYIYKCEEQKEIQPLNDKGIVKTISEAYAKISDISKETMQGLMNRKEYIKGKK